MPTGYTAPILDGKVKNFKQYAKVCMRAFGATIHMRDDDFDAKYRKAEPSNYHKDKLVEIKKQMEDLLNMSDEALALEQEKSIKQRISRANASLKKIEKQKSKLNEILADVRKWTPPTDDHTELKEFMIDQILKTIDFDCKTRYYDEELERCTSELKNIDPKSIRQERMDCFKNDINYHTKNYAEEVERCRDRNKWVEDLLDSI